MKLPRLFETSCRHLLACGVLDDDETDAIKWVGKNSYHECAKVKVGGKNTYIRFILGGAPFEGHCHLEVATKEYFGSGNTPPQTKKWKEIQDKLAQLLDKQITFRVSGLYTIPIEKLPTIIKTTRNFDVVQDGVSIKMTDGRLRVTGAPINSISWALPDNEIALITLEAGIETQLNEDFLVLMFGLLQDGFQSFIESGVPHGDEQN